MSDSMANIKAEISSAAQRIFDLAMQQVRFSPEDLAQCKFSV